MSLQNTAGICLQNNINELPDKASRRTSTYSYEGPAGVRPLTAGNTWKAQVEHLTTQKSEGNVLLRQQGLEGPIALRRRKYKEVRPKFAITFPLASLAFFDEDAENPEGAIQRLKS